MTFPSEPGLIRWRLHLAAPPEAVYGFLAAPAGRARFWAESAEDDNGFIVWRFPNGETARTRLLEQKPPHRFVVEYLGGSTATFELISDGARGTDLTLTDEGVPERWRVEVTTGWVSALLALKAAVDFGVDLRNHDPQRTWEHGFVDN